MVNPTTNHKFSMKPYILPAILFVWLIGIFSGFGQEPGSREAEVNRLAQALVSGGLVPGLAIGVYDSGRAF